MPIAALNPQSLAELSAERLLNCAAEGIIIALLAWLLLRASVPEFGNAIRCMVRGIARDRKPSPTRPLVRNPTRTDRRIGVHHARFLGALHIYCLAADRRHPAVQGWASGSGNCTGSARVACQSIAELSIQ